MFINDCFQCKGYLDPIKNVLKKFRVMSDKDADFSKDKRIKKTKKVIINITSLF